MRIFPQFQVRDKTMKPQQIFGVTLIVFAWVLSSPAFCVDVKIEKVEFEGWKNCRRMSNGTIDLIAVADIGPRIISFGFTGDENEFHVWKETLGKTGGLEWHPYGGHRLWAAPEAKPRTYYPDNVPVTVTEKDQALILTAPVERNPEFEGSSGIQKEMMVEFVGKDAVRITHRITNRNEWTIELAVWAPTFMKPGGRLIVPNPPYGPHAENLLPVRTIALWKYSEMGDPQFHWGNRYIILEQDSTRTKPNKFGVANVEGWAAYERGDHAFVKYHSHDPEAAYPDMGCSLESFTDNETLEFETLGPLWRILPGETVEHVEHWRLLKGISATLDEESIDRELKEKVGRIKN